MKSINKGPSYLCRLVQSPVLSSDQSVIGQEEKINTSGNGTGQKAAQLYRGVFKGSAVVREMEYVCFHRLSKGRNTLYGQKFADA